MIGSGLMSSARSDSTAGSSLGTFAWSQSSQLNWRVCRARSWYCRERRTMELRNQWAAVVPPALVLVQSQIVADPIESMMPSARKHSLYAMTNELV